MTMKNVSDHESASEAKQQIKGKNKKNKGKKLTFIIMALKLLHYKGSTSNS
jgi:hypothetical protein